ncbi:MAG TPA: peptidylprolyl isomerase, partial [Anaerolineae bacterium]|nr:peptidylprolyl isomerase [Anaerolineae bacterium]
VADQVHARHILLETLEEAEAALVRLRDGEGFEELAAELSQDTASKDQGGDLGWFPREQMVSAFSEAAFALEPGEISGVIESEFGYHIIRVDERETDRELDATARWEAESRVVDDWFAAQRASQDIVRHWDSVLASEE